MYQTKAAFFILSNPPLPPPRCHDQGAGEKGHCQAAKDFAITGSAACPGIKFIYIGKAEVESKIKALDELAFTGIKQLKGIRKIHHMV